MVTQSKAERWDEDNGGDHHSKGSQWSAFIGLQVAVTTTAGLTLEPGTSTNVHSYLNDLGYLERGREAPLTSH